MNIADVLAIQVTLDGMNRVLDGFESLAREVDATDKSLSRLARTGAVVTAVGAGLGIVAVKSYEAFARMQRSFETMLGETKGQKMANDIMAMGEASQFTGEQIRGMAVQWINMTGQVQKTLPILKAMEAAGKMGGLNNDQFGRMGVALAQIQGMGKVQWMDYMQLVNAGAPLSAVQKQLGLAKPKDIIGLDADKFINGFIEAMKKASGDDLNLPTVRIQNIWETFSNGMIKTGALIAALAVPFLLLLEWGARAVAWINNLTGGVAGLVVIIALVVIGFRMMAGLIARVSAAYAAQIGASGRATVALNMLAAAAQRAAIGTAAGGAGQAAGGAAGAAAAGAGGAAAVGWWGKITAAVSRFFGIAQTYVIEYGAVLLAFLTGPLLVIIGAFVILGAVMFGVIKLIELITGNANNDESFGTGKNWQKRFHDWLPDWLVGPPEDAKKETAAQRPQNRSSWENVYNRRWGHQMSG